MRFRFKRLKMVQSWGIKFFLKKLDIRIFKIRIIIREKMFFKSI